MSSTGEIFREQNRNMLRQSGKVRTMFWILLIIIVFVIMVIMSSGRRHVSSPIPANCRQLIVVQTPSWSASKGILKRYERCTNESDWTLVGNKVPIILGRNGMGWGRGLQSIPDDGCPVKREGDGKSPAGVFFLGNAFGFPTKAEIGDLKIPYKSVDEYLECIDDINSQYYNNLVENNIVDTIDWNSSEHIQRSPNAYHFGLVVNHNTTDTKKGAGSCIFLHCVAVDGDSTAGCTTMAREEMGNILRWLDKGCDPILVQLPVKIYSQYQKDWKLPE